jgi:RHS repeat-associated protein
LTCAHLSTFQYDAFGHRISKNVNGNTTGFLYDRKNIVQELSPTAVTANLLTGLRTDEVFSRTDSAGARSFLVDVLGSTVALTDSVGAIQTQYTYEPFGKTTSSGSPSSNPFEFTGRENDGTGLYFYRARYNSTEFRRFISEDPIGVKGGVNLFAYAADNPVNFKDPCGLKPDSGNGGDPPGCHLDQGCYSSCYAECLTLGLIPPVALPWVACGICAILPPPFAWGCYASCIMVTTALLARNCAQRCFGECYRCE